MGRKNFSYAAKSTTLSRIGKLAISLADACWLLPAEQREVIMGRSAALLGVAGRSNPRSEAHQTALHAMDMLVREAESAKLESRP